MRDGLIEQSWIPAPRGRAMLRRGAAEVKAIRLM
jgi:hypothetical protein